MMAFEALGAAGWAISRDARSFRPLSRQTEINPPPPTVKRSRPKEWLGAALRN